MMEDAFEGMDDEDEMEEAAEEEVDKILFEITAGEENCSFFIVTYFFYSDLIFKRLSHHKLNCTAKHWNLCVVVGSAASGALGKAPSKVTDALPEVEPPGAAAASDEESEEDIEEMQSRLEALRS